MRSKRFIGVLSVATVLLMVLAGFAAVPGAGAQENEYRVIVMFDDTVDEKVVKDAGGTVKKTYTIMPAVVATMDSDGMKDLRKSSKVKSVDLDYKVTISKKPSSPPGKDKDPTPEEVLELQWGADRIDAEKAWDTSTGSSVSVAVLDTGIDTDHPELSAVYAGGYDFVNGDYMPEDDNGHGTHVAGVIAAQMDYQLDDADQQGVVGVSHGVSIYALKVLNSRGSGYYSDIAAAIYWSINEGVDVISMSLSGPSSTTQLEDACDAAYDAGIVIVAAAGNTGKRRAVFDSVQYPARYGTVMAIGATDSKDRRASFSATGPAVELVAPGVNVMSTYLNGGYATGSGTSMACPHVAGTVALVLATSVDPAYDGDNDNAWDPAEVRQLLRDTADDLGDTGKDNEFGYGIVDAEEAVTGSAY
ncbi:MAG: S8 family peptidase [Thermoplasmata archaeon]|nr:S8 family peptidase [Thermoplasmata archaeon]